MGWLTAAIVCTCIGIMFASYISLSTCDEGEKLKFIVTFAVTIIVSYIIANAITYVSTMPYKPKERLATFAEAAATYDINSGDSYPLSLGGKSVSLSGEMTVTGNAFYISGQATFQGGTTLLVGFQHSDGIREILEIPLASVDFVIIPDDEMSTMSIDLSTVTEAATGYEVHETFDSDCRPSIRFGWWTAKCTTSVQSFSISPSTNEGLANLLKRAFASSSNGKVAMRVTEDQYRQILSSSAQTETPTPSPTQR